MRRLIPFQAKIADQDGTAITGLETVTFKFYTQAYGGTAFWTETRNGVSVNQGVFNVMLGSTATHGAVSAGVVGLDTAGGAPISPYLKFWSTFATPVYVGITRQGQSEYTGRLLLPPAVFAFDALRAKVADNGPNLPPVAVLKVTNLEAGATSNVDILAGDDLKLDASLSYVPSPDYAAATHFDNTLAWHADRKEATFEFDLYGEGAFSAPSEDPVKNYTTANGGAITDPGTYIVQLRVKSTADPSGPYGIAQVMIRVK